ncbi:MAG: ribosome recycling factor [bacterium]
MVEQMVASAKPKMEAAVEHLLSELKTLRTGRASAQMLDSVQVVYYGTQTPLKALANLTVPEPTQILIQPFDASAVKDIVTAIKDSGLGFNPSDDGRSIRLIVPPLTAERREELVKMAHKMGEESRISIRQIRGKVWDEIQKAQKDSEITEENRDWGRDEIDKLTADHNKKIEQAIKDKEAEIRTV